MGNDPLWRSAATHTLHVALVLKNELEDRLLAAEGLLLADNEALLNLDHSPLRMTEIAERLVLSRGGTTKVIDRLEEMGYAMRTDDPDDRRATLVEITPDGSEAVRRARKVVDAYLQTAFADTVTDEEASVIVAALSRVLDDLRDHDPDMGPAEGEE
jgi:DNA-binding MarR family transcriptional regulator